MPAQVFTLDEALAIHAHQIARYAGALGVRDRGLLESALAMPAATFAGHYLHPSLPEQAAAYLFHLVKNIRSSMATSASAWRAASPFSA